jgi:hypothetical protein
MARGMARGGAGGSNAYIFVDASDAFAMLAGIEVAISPPSLAGWLSTEMTPFLRHRARMRFAAEGDDTVGRWHPLRESTNEIRESMGYPRAHPINRRSGELEDYIVNSPADVRVAGVGAELTFPGVSPGSGELEDKVWTAQEGRGFGGTHVDRDPHTIPRPVLGLGAPDLEFALVGLNGWVHTMVAAGGQMAGRRTATARSIP